MNNINEEIKETLSTKTLSTNHYGKYSHTLLEGFAREFDIRLHSRVLSDMVAKYVTINGKLNELLRINDEIEKGRMADLRAASKVQNRFLTNSEETEKVLINAGLKAVFFNSHVTNITGDFFFPKAMTSGEAGLFVADTCGHGVSAAVVSMRILSIIDHCPAPNLHPSEFLSVINRDIYGLLTQEISFVAGIYFIFHPNKIIFSNAGQPTPLLVRGAEVLELKSSSSPIGMYPRLEANEVTYDFISGDRLVIHSDGLIESMNAKGNPFGPDRLIDFLRNNSSLSLNEMKSSLVSEIQRFTNKFDDDVTIIIIEKE
ncbi:MAG: serine/threonine-protein phosphatase [Nitrospirae bacterium]|nr:serine/threonine-protein phosphatase [Nitrospirota bacterium]